MVRNWKEEVMFIQWAVLAMGYTKTVNEEILKSYWDYIDCLDV